MRWGLVIFALLLALAALGFGSAYYVTQPVTLRVAVAPSDSHSRQFLDATADILAATKAAIRLTVTPADAPLSALDKREAEFAVARSVDIIKAQAQTVLALRQDAAVIIVPKAAKITTLPDLTKASIGVVRESYMDGAGLAAVMNYYGVDVGKLKLTPLQASDVAAAIRDKRINAVVVAGNLRAKSLADIVAVAVKNIKGGIRFMDIEAAEAIAKRLPEVEAIEIDKGLFGGYPPLPDETVNTIGVSVRLVADPRVSGEQASDFLHAFSRVKQQVVARVTGSGGVSIPDPDEETAFALHQGVRVYNKGEIVSPLEKYSDQIYVGGLVTSALGSLFAAALGMMETRRRKKSIAEVIEIERVRQDIETARTEGELAALETRANEVFGVAVKKAMHGQIDPAAVSAFDLAHRQVRESLIAKRLVLADNPAPVAALVSAR